MKLLISITWYISPTYLPTYSNKIGKTQILNVKMNYWSPQRKYIKTLIVFAYSKSKSTIFYTNKSTNTLDEWPFLELLPDLNATTQRRSNNIKSFISTIKIS